MKKTLMNVKVTIVNNDEEVNKGKRGRNGALSLSADAKEMKFVE